MQPDLLVQPDHQDQLVHLELWVPEVRQVLRVCVVSVDQQAQLANKVPQDQLVQLDLLDHLVIGESEVLVEQQVRFTV